MVLFASCLARPVAPDTAADAPHKYVGLRNPTKTTCHLNAVLQALYMTPEFRDEFLNTPLGEMSAAGRAIVPTIWNSRSSVAIVAAPVTAPSSFTY